MTVVKSLKLLLVGNFLSDQRGTRFYCEDLAERLERVGLNVTTTSRKSGRVARLLDTLFTVATLRRIYDVAVVDVYSGGGFWLAAIQILMLRALRKPVVAVLHGGGLPDFNAAHRGSVSRVLRLAHKIVTPSIKLREAFNGIVNDIAVVPNAMDLSAYPFRPRAVNHARLCWLRAFDTAYDPVMAVRAMAIVHKRYPKASLTMVGPVKRQELLDESRRAISDAGLADVVKIVGPIRKQDVPKLLARHDAFINTTRFESFGVAVMEAAASGVPIVSTAAGEIPYLWSDGVDALLVPVGDSQAMADAILRLLDDPSLALSISAAARVKAELFDWQEVIPQWVELLQKTSRDSLQPSGAGTKMFTNRKKNGNC